MKNTKARQPDPVSGTIAHEGVNKAMNDPMGSASNAAANLNTDKSSDSANSVTDSVTQVLTDSDRIDPDDLTNEMAQDGQDDLQEGLTPIHHQSIDESRIDEVLVEDSLDDDHYPTIRDIADNEAIAHSREED